MRRTLFFLVVAIALPPLAAQGLPPVDLSRVGYSGAMQQRADPSLSGVGGSRPVTRPSLAPGAARPDGLRPDRLRPNLQQPGYVRPDYTPSDYAQPGYGRANYANAAAANYPAYASGAGYENRPYYGNRREYAYQPSYAYLHNHWRPGYWASSYRPYYAGYYQTGTAISLGGLTSAYVNPFYRAQNLTVPALDYSAPIHIPPSGYQETAEDMIRSEQAVRMFDDARFWFRRAQYARAADLIDKALAILPSDPALHQFRALVLFATQRYADASATIYSVLSVASGWDRETIERLYDDPNRYVTDVRNLANYVNQRPDDSAAQFLLAYHYLAVGELPTAAQLLQQVQAANPGDRVTQNLLDAIRQRAGR